MNLLKAATALKEHWSPAVVGRVNDQYVKVAKLKGEFTWHQHDDEDEMFLVLAGELTIEYADHAVVLGPGDFHVVPRATQHNPHCTNECLVALIETVTTQHTGEVVHDLTRSVEIQLNNQPEIDKT